MLSYHTSTFAQLVERTAKQCGESDSYRLRGYRPRYVNEQGEYVEILERDSAMYRDYLNAWNANESLGDFIEYT
tara:strand:- start:431 stop:652 length:222 start_codon:yes stop_codon:yes gene_type:complete